MALKNKMKSMLHFELFFCMFLICLLVVFFVESLSYSHVARRAPHYVMVPLAVFLLIQMIQIISELGKFRDKQQTDEQVSSNNLLVGAAGNLTLRKTLVIPMAAVLLFMFIFLTGQVVGIALFLTLFLRYFSKERWTLSIALGVITSAFLYLVFQKLLKILLDQGIICEYLITLIIN